MNIFLRVPLYMGILGYLSFSGSSMDDQSPVSWEKGNCSNPAALPSASIKIPQGLLTETVASSFSKHYSVHFERSSGNWVFYVGNIADDLIKQFEKDLKIFSQHQTIPIENIHSSLSNYVPKNDSQNKLVKWTKRLIQYTGPKTSGVFMTGAVGIGKTHIAVSIIKECQQEIKNSLFIQPHEIANKYRQYDQFWPSCNIFILDDFNGDTSYEDSLVYSLVSYAFAKGGCKIFITSSQDYDHFVRRVGQKAEPRRDIEKFTDRIRSVFKAVEVTGESNRKSWWSNTEP